MNNVHIIVSRYNEKLTWLLNYPFTEFKYIVYNKGDDEDFEKLNVIKIINLKNVGRESHTYLYHIIENYDILPNILVFFPGSIELESKYNKAKSILINIINSQFLNAYFIGKKTKSLYENFNDFSIDHHTSTSKENNSKNNESELQKCKLRPYNKWYKFFFKHNNAKWFTYCGIFSINTKDIKQHPKERYKNFIKILEQSSNPEAGHYIERSWGAILYPMINTIKINE
jgi:hypothetical protein